MPEATPVTTPDPELTVAIPVALLDHVPPETLLVRVVVWPKQALNVPLIVPRAFTDTTVVALQPEPKV